MNTISIFVILFFMFCGSVFGARILDLPNSKSPDGCYRLRLQDAVDSDSVLSLQIMDVRHNSVAGSFSVGGYADFEHESCFENLQFLWSPDSRYIALADRVEKRGWAVSVYTITDGKIKSVKLPDTARFIFDKLHAKESFRFTHASLVRWIDSDKLLIKINGDAVISNENVLSYEAQLIITISKSTIQEFKPLFSEQEKG